MKRTIAAFMLGLGVGVALWAMTLPNCYELEDRVERLIRDKSAMRVKLDAVSDVCRAAIELGVQR